MTFHIFANLVKKNNITVYFNDKLEDWNNPNSFLQSSILTAINEYQASLQSYQTKKSLKDNAKEGKSFGVYPYGYKSDDGYLIIDENEKQIVELIYKLSLEGKGTRSIAQYLNDQQIPTRYNKIGKGTITVKNKYTGTKKKIQKKDIKWSGNSVRGIIINTIYKGKRKWGDDYFEVKPIFEEQYWQIVNDNLTNNSNNRGKKVVHKYLLKGLLRCGECGRNMYGRSRVSKKDHYYQCSSKRIKGKSCGNRSINIDKIEGVVWSRFFKGDELLKLLKSDIKKEDNQIQDLEDSIEEHLNKLNSFKNEFQRLISLSAKGVFTDEEIFKEKNSINNNINQQKAIIDDYQKQISNARNSKMLIDDYVNEFNSYTDKITFLEKKEIINKYFKDIVVYSSTEIIGLYLLVFKFKLNLKEERYIFSSRFKVLININDKKIVFSKHFNSIIEDDYIDYGKKLLNKFVLSPEGELKSIPFYEKDNGITGFAYNTIFPYGNMADWNLKKMIKFYDNNPKWLCSESGLSIVSLDKTTDGYRKITNIYKSFKAKDNSVENWLTTFMKTKAFRNEL
jgi:DNA invertase Pin-like site-specific DNA recombinase